MKVTRQCDNCGKLLRKAELRDNLIVNGKPSKYKKLCKDCFELWLEGELGENEPDYEEEDDGE